MSQPVLEIEDLTVYRGNTPTVEQVSLTLNAGTDTAIIGPNGAGKSTLIQSILGILPRHRGEVFILGYPLTRKGKLDQRVRQQVAYLPQNFGFDRRIPIQVEEFVGLGWHRLSLQFPWSHQKQCRLAVAEALSRVEGLSLRHKPISELSGGETKRVLLAYCLVRPRRLLILDEAPAGLDFRGESDFYQLLYQLKKEQGWAILQISHDLDMVRRHCDRVICFNRNILCQGSPESALSSENLALAYGEEFVRYQHSCRE